MLTSFHSELQMSPNPHIRNRSIQHCRINKTTQLPTMICKMLVVILQWCPTLNDSSIILDVTSRVPVFTLHEARSRPWESKPIDKDDNRDQNFRNDWWFYSKPLMEWMGGAKEASVLHKHNIWHNTECSRSHQHIRDHVTYRSAHPLDLGGNPCNQRENVQALKVRTEPWSLEQWGSSSSWQQYNGLRLPFPRQGQRWSHGCLL